LTLIQAAERLGIGRDTLSDLERGNRHPVMPTLAKIAEGYDVPVEELLEEPASLTEAEIRKAKPLKETDLRPETDALLDRDMDEFEELLATYSDDELIDLQQQLLLLLRHHYGPKVFETQEEMIAYIEGGEKKRGDKAGRLLRRARKEYDARIDSVLEAREEALTLG
jgi:transcriptional regulator with XRE-family HTH domain